MAVTPTTGKFGGSKAAVFLVAGYNMLAAKVQTLRYRIEALAVEGHGLGDSWTETIPSGLMRAEVAQEGGFWDTSTTGSHVALKDSVGATRILCLGFGGNAIGQPFFGVQGACQTSYDVLAAIGQLTKANAEYAVTGRGDQGTIIHAHTAETTDPATTEPTNAVDWSTDPQAWSVAITSSSVANPTVITTPVPHGLTSGDLVLIAGHSGSTPTINGERVATVTGPTTFTVPVNVTVGGTGGTAKLVQSQRGGVGYLQVSALTLGGFTNATVTIRHSADGVTFANLVSFTAVTSAPAAQRVEVSGTVNRYLSSTVDFTGSGSGQSITYFTGFSRF